MSTVFIAYNAIDEATVLNPVRDHLRNAHRLDSVWFDEALFGAGTFWEDTRRQIQRAALVIYLAGDNTRDRPILDEARAQHKPLLVVRTAAATHLPSTAHTLTLQQLPLTDADRTQIDRALEHLGIIEADAVLNRPSDFMKGFDDLNFATPSLGLPTDPATPSPDDDLDQRLARVATPSRAERLLPGLIAVIVTVVAVLVGINFFASSDELANPTSFPTTRPLDRQGTNAAIEQTADALVPDNTVPNNTVPNNTVPNNTVPNNTVPNNTSPRQNTPTLPPNIDSPFGG